MSVKASYQCLDCGEVFENRIQALAHHFETKHQNYEMIGCEIRISVKS